MTDKKPDKYESKAAQIFDVFDSDLHDASDEVETWNDVKRRAINMIAAALREAAECKETPETLHKDSECKETPETLHKDSVCKVSEEELRDIAIVAVRRYEDSGDFDDDADYLLTMFKAGFRKAQSMNAIARIEWPSEESWALADNVPEVHRQIWIACYRGLKDKVLGK